MKVKKFRRDKTEAVYDENARREYLTGFHKRKKQRQKEAQTKILERQKEEKRAERAEIRETARAEATTTVEYNIPVLAEEGEGEQRKEFADDFSKAAFGAHSVVVTTTLGLGEEVDDGTDRLRDLAAPHKATMKRRRETQENKRVERKERKDREKEQKGKKGGGIAGPGPSGPGTKDLGSAISSSHRDRGDDGQSAPKKANRGRA